ncbi:hypothetical protein R75461_07968 [Paraburkholderia nemoris]|uniref:hypothetical protein n=1 Tax=Paraburkholderia nemoris TaxID=2793076 RepID=UPI00190C51D2|nr:MULTISPECIES: hypothetical protein [Paraburkholderia]MBK3786736.1 hypothetical protein [Paraburkholderia aspalathi]CAE6860760.1 hypothetical protein R75461_07968 [Paraburkholderia nemoris]
MPHQTPFMDMAYPDEAGRPCALQFRIALTATAERLAVVHLRHGNAEYQSPMESSIVRDQLLNRILDVHLRGVPVNAIRLVVESGGKSSLFPIDFDVGDYIKRGDPYEATHVTTGRGLFRERVAIRSESVVAGRTRVQTSHAEPLVVPKDIAGALR